MWQAEHNAEQLLSSLSIDYRGKKKAKKKNPKSRITKAEWRNRCAKNLLDYEEEAIDTNCLKPGQPYITDVVDPITFKCMENPVVLADHRCYDASSFKGPMKEKDPLTNLDWEPTSWHRSSLIFETGETFKKFCHLNRWKNARDDMKDIHVKSDAFERSVINAFADTIKIGALPNLEGLYFYDDHIDKNGMTIFANLFKGATLTNLKSFVVEYETISSDAAQKLATAVLNKPTLESFGRIPIKQLLAKELPELDLSRYGRIPKVGVPEALVLKQLLPVSSLTSLDLARNELRAEGAKALADGGAFTGSLTSLDLSYNQLEAEAAKALAPAIRDSGSLISLDLSNNPLHAEGAIALVDGGAFKGSLTRLNLEDNFLKAEGAKALAPAIRDSGSLTNISLASNNIGGYYPEGAQSEADFIATPEGPKALAEAIAVKLKELWLNDNKISDTGMQAFAAACDSGALSQLRTLSLTGNNIRNDGMQAFAAACGSGAMANLTELWLSSNEIGDAGMQAFAVVLGSGSGALPALTSLWLEHNQIGNEGMAAFSAALGSGALPALEELYVDDELVEHPQLMAACEPRDILIQ